MSERFSKKENDKNRVWQIDNAAFGCFGVLLFPIFGTAVSKTQIGANHALLTSNLGFIFSLCLIPLVFFGIYRLDRAVEKRVPKRRLENAIKDGETKVLR